MTGLALSFGFFPLIFGMILLYNYPDQNYEKFSGVPDLVRYENSYEKNRFKERLIIHIPDSRELTYSFSSETAEKYMQIMDFSDSAMTDRPRNEPDPVAKTFIQKEAHVLHMELVQESIKSTDIIYQEGRVIGLTINDQVIERVLPKLPIGIACLLVGLIWIGFWVWMIVYKR